MNSKIKIIIDSNYIYSMDSDRLSEKINDIKTKGDIYLPVVVLDELIHRDLKNIRKFHRKVNKHEPLGMAIRTQDIDERFVDELREYYINLFDNNIIEMSTVDIEKMYKRAISKTPPFLEEKDSDEGFKDSLIWLSILEDNYRDYDEIVFLTNDNGFIKNKNKLQNEFKDKYGIEINILRDYGKIQEIEKQDTPNTTEPMEKEHSYNQRKILEDFKKIELYRDQLDEILYKITMEQEYNSFGEYYDYPRFKISEKIELLPIEKLLNNLQQVTKENILKKMITPNEFLSIFEDVSVFAVSENIQTKNLVQLYELLLDAHSELNNYSKSIVKAIVDYIVSKTYTYESDSFAEIENIDDDELPF